MAAMKPAMIPTRRPPASRAATPMSGTVAMPSSVVASWCQPTEVAPKTEKTAR